MPRLLLLLTLLCSATFLCEAQTSVKEQLSEPITETWQVTPEFPGGINAFTKYVEGNLKPTANGKLYVRFVIETDGKLSDIQIVKSINEETDNRLIQILEKCPAWTPGSVGDKAVRMGYLYPIIISSVRD